jgi:hypothetical protein
MTVGQLLCSISARELAEWRAFFRLENKRRQQTEAERKAKAMAEAPRRGKSPVRRRRN